MTITAASIYAALARRADQDRAQAARDGDIIRDAVQEKYAQDLDRLARDATLDDN